MNAHTQAECSSWMTLHNFQFDEGNQSEGKDGYVFLPSDGIDETLIIPEESWSRLLLSHELVKWFGKAKILFWITAWPAYQQTEMDFFDAFRIAHGDDRRIIDAPGYLLDTSQALDSWAMVDLILLLMTFNWEGFILRSDQTSMIWMADERIEVFTRSIQNNGKLRDAVSTLNISYLKR